MSDNQTQTPDAEGSPAPSQKGKLSTIVLYSMIGLLSAAGGFSLPLLFPQLVGGAMEQPSGVAPVAIPQSSKPVFVTFDELVVNLNSDRFNRYLKLALSLQVDESQLILVKDKIERKKVRLKSWLISYLSDKSMDEIRGAAGQNRLRREIQDHFNSELFDDGYDRINDVLFEEFNVQ